MGPECAQWRVQQSDRPACGVPFTFYQKKIVTAYFLRSNVVGWAGVPRRAKSGVREYD
jgi:hypothetical protein